MNRRSFLGLLATASLAGCQSIEPDSDFEVSLVNIEPGTATVWETTLFATIRLQNASPNPVRIEGGTHKIYLNGTYLGQGLSSEAVEIPRLDTITTRVEVHLRNLTFAKKLLELQKNPSVAYRIESALFLGGRFGKRIRARKEGSLNLAQFVPPTR